MVFEQLINTPKTCLITREKIGKKDLRQIKRKLMEGGLSATLNKHTQIQNINIKSRVIYIILHGVKTFLHVFFEIRKKLGSRFYKIIVLVFRG